MAVMADETRIPIRIDSDIVIARQQGRAMATRLGFRSSDATLVATVISEVARNIVTYAREGELLLAALQQGSRRGLLVVARDDGPGIADVQRALQDGFSTSGSLGLGLPGSKRMMDEFHISSQLGKGTTVTMKKWVR
jgi:serine/threonine-protein kinase RsbT